MVALYVWLVLLKRKLGALYRNVRSVAQRRPKAEYMQLDIRVVSTSTTLLRDLLICLNSMCNHVASTDKRIDQVQLEMQPGAIVGNVAEVASCLLLFDMIENSSVHWLHDFHDQDDSAQDCDTHGQVERQSLCVRLNGIQVPRVCLDHYVCSSAGNHLTLSPNKKAWAHNFLMRFHPGTFVVVTNLPESRHVGDLRHTLCQWEELFQRMELTYPMVHFMVLNPVAHRDGELLARFHNLTSTKLIGLEFMDEIALTKACDLYVGPFDEYAVAVIGTEKPFILLGGSTEESQGGNTEMTWSHRHQAWLREVPPPEQLLLKIEELIKGTMRPERAI